jgi:hypothetical protein
VSHLLRVALLAYPRQFRRHYGTEWARTLVDLHVHSGHSTPRVAVTVVGEVFTTAVRMRWENLMATTKRALMVIIGALALVALMMGSTAIILLIGALVALIGLQVAGKDRPIAADKSLTTDRWYLWLAGAAVAVAVGFGALATSTDGELNSAQWATWMISWAGAAVLGVIGLSLGARRLITNRT